jgi:hypothetical protein
MTRLLQRNGVLGARLEDKEHDIATLEGRLAKLKRRLKEADSFAPRAWAVKEAVQGGYALEAAGLVPNSAGADSSRPNGGLNIYCVCVCVYVYIYIHVHTHTHTHTHTYISMHTHTHTHTHKHTYVCIYAYVYIYRPHELAPRE